MEVREIATKIFLSVKIHIERQKIGEVDVEIFGGREISITGQGLRRRLFGHFEQLMEKFADASRPVPAHDIRRNLIPHQISKSSRIILAGLNTLGNRPADLCPRRSGIKKTNVLGPRNSNHHAETID